MDDRERQLIASATYRKLTRQRQRLATGLTLVLLALYFGFDVLSIHLPELLGRALGPQGALSVGIAAAFAIALLSVLFALYYVHRANTTFLRLEQQLDEELRK